MKSTKKFMNKIQELKENDLGISIRKLRVMNKEIFILYIPQLTDRQMLSDNIIKPILEYRLEKKLVIDIIMGSIISIDDLSMDHNEDQVIDYILKGKSVIIMPNDEKYIIANTLKIEKRGTQAPEIENAIRAPKDAFTENFDANLSLIRYRIKDPSLRIHPFALGRRTKTNIALIYISDVANPKHVEEIKKRLENIDIDGIVESGYIQKFISNNPFSLFPQLGIVERSDMACTSILEGKVCIIVEGSNLGLITPKTFIEFLDSCDDHYDSMYLGIFAKFLRIIAIIISLTLSSLYVAVVSFHPDILPPQYILALAVSRATVPFNALLEALGMEVITELLREASIRLPKQIGSAIGIVGTIVIGQAAVSAGLVSPLMVIIASLSTMASLAAPDYTIINPIRILKFMMIFITGILGLFGFVIGLIFISIHLISLTSFDVPYIAPIAPFHYRDIKNYILSNITLAKKRPSFLNTKDKTRQ